jgi:mycofactocin precursor
MAEETTQATAVAPEPGAPATSASASASATLDAGTPPADALVEADLLVEDVSIDGMCGVY